MCFTILCSCILHFSLWPVFVVISVVLISCNAVLQVAWASFSHSFGFGLWVSSTCSSAHRSVVTSAAVSRLVRLCFCWLRFCGWLCRGFGCGFEVCSAAYFCCMFDVLFVSIDLWLAVVCELRTRLTHCNLNYPLGEGQGNFGCGCGIGLAVVLAAVVGLVWLWLWFWGWFGCDSRLDSPVVVLGLFGCGFGIG